MGDYTFHDKMQISYETMLKQTTAIFRGAGMNEKDAATVADTLVMADARGVYSHGVMRTPIYCRRFFEGGTDPKGKPEIIKDMGPTVLVDGHNAMGQVVSCYSMEIGIERAKKYGSATVSATGSNHLGTCAYYAEMAARANMVGFVWTINGINIMAPWGGTDCRLGNNPFAIAVPCNKKPTVVLDMALSVVARGKLVMAMKTKSKVPEAWALDKNGKPTTDPEAGYWGSVRPMGDYKGYGLSFMNAIISAILSNSCFGPTVSDLYEQPAVVQNMGHLFQVIDIDAISNAAEFKQRMDDAVDYLKASPKADGVDEIYVPGEMEARNLERQLKEGITYPVEVLEENRQLAKKLGVDIII